VENNILTCKSGMRTPLSALYFITVQLQWYQFTRNHSKICFKWPCD